MILNETALDLAFRGFKSIYTDAYNKAETHHGKIAMTVPSSAREEAYGWLGQFPQLREWVGGERIVKVIKAHGFSIQNRKFESTVGIKREDFADDRLGVFKPMFAEMGQLAAMHPDQLLFSLLKLGGAELCYDGQYFFDTDHPSVDADGNTISVSNTAGDNALANPWYLLDTSRAIRPLIWQEREKYDFQTINNIGDTRVFMTDEFLYGVRARVNAGYGLWQLAYRSVDPLDEGTYAAARTAMRQLRGDQGRVLDIKPNVLIVPTGLEAAARRLLMSERHDNGASNVWKDSADIIVTPHVE